MAICISQLKQLSSNVIIAVNVFYCFFCDCTGANFFLIGLKGVYIEANFCKDENVLDVRRIAKTSVSLFILFQLPYSLN